MTSGQSFGDPGFGGGGNGGGGDQTRRATVVLDANTSAYGQQMAAASQQTSQLSAQVAGLVTSLDSLSKRAGRKLEILGAANFASLSAMTAGAAAFEKQLSTLHATAVVTGRDFGQMEESIHRLTKQFPISHESATQLATAISNLGVTGTRDIGKLAEVFVKLGGATGEDIGGLAQNMVQLSRTMGNLDPVKIGNFANSLLTVSKNAGVSATGVLEFSQAISPIARSAGMGEAAVIGISTAFKKAGADGFVAANTFNSIVSDIAQLERTGAPGIAKYASLLGQTAEQFKAAGIQQNAMDLFRTFGQDNPRVRAFLDQNYGIRAQRALLAVGQSGDMQTYVNQAMRASGNQRNLQRGSQAAFDNLVDDLTKLRNQVSLLADEIGKPLLGVVDPLVKALTAMLSGVNAVVKGMGPLATTLAAALSVLGPFVIGGGISHIGVLAAAGTARLALGRQSILRQSIEAGRADRLAGTTGELGAALAAGGEGTLYRQRAGYAMGQGRLLDLLPFAMMGSGRHRGTGAGAYEARHDTGGVGRHRATEVALGSSAAEVEARAVAGRVQRIPSDALAKMAPGEIAAWYGVSPTRMAAFAAARAPGGFVRSYAGMQRIAAEQANASYEARLAMAQRNAERGIGVPTREMLENAAFAAASGQSMFGAGARAAGRGAVGAIGATGAIAGQGFRSAAAGAARFLPALGRGALGALTGLGAGPLGLLAMTVAPPIISSIMGHGEQERRAATTTGDFLNPVRSLNDSLGLATQYVSRFGAAVDKAASAVEGKPVTLTGLRAPTAETVAAQKGQPKPEDEASQIFLQLGKKGKLDVKTATTVLKSMVASGAKDPRALGQLQTAMAQGGMSPEDIATVFQSVITPEGNLISSAPSQADIARAVFRVGGETGNRIAAAGTAALSVQQQQAAGSQGAGAQAAQALQGAMQSVTSYGKQVPRTGPNGQIQGNDTFFTQIGRLTGTSMEKARDAWNKLFYTLPGFAGNPDNPNDVLAIIGALKPEMVNEVYRTTGSALLDQNGNLDTSKIPGYLGQQAGQARPVQPTGPLRMNPILRSLEAPTTAYAQAQGTSIGQPSMIQRGAEEAYMTALRAAGGNAGMAAQILMGGVTELGGAAGGTPPALLQAQQFARSQQALTRPMMTTAATTQQLQANLQASRAMAMQANAPQEAIDQYNADRQAYQEHVVSMLQANRQFAISMQRGDEDYQHSRLMSEKSYNLQVQRSRRDFNIQMGRQERDFGIQMNRTLEDRTRQLKNQSAQLAQTIYNPFERVVGKFTMDADTLYQNLQDQNERLAKQKKQLDQLSQMGLSTEAIQTLNLSSPENAQQLDTLVQTALQDPKILARINAQIRTRMALTTAVSQNRYSLEFIQSQKEFTIQLDRTTADYQKAMRDARQSQNIALQDAAENQTIALNEMAYQQGKAVKRAGEDLNNTVLQLTDSMGNLYPSALSQMAEAVEKYSPQAAASIRTTLNELAAEFPGLNFKPSAAGSGANTQAGTAYRNRDKQRGGQLGGIGVREQSITAFEAGPEALIPLNERGEAFMAATIVRSLAAAFQIVSRQAPAPVSQQMSADHSTNFNGPIQVVAQDTRQLERELAAKAKLRKLTSPTRRTG